MSIEPQASTAGVRSVLFSASIILLAMATGLMVLHKVVVDPRTDDAEIFANFIGIAPVISGPIEQLHVADNQLIQEGQPLFEVDERPYAYALAQAESDLQVLRGQIGNQRRTIASLASGVDVARSVNLSSEAGVDRAKATVKQAQADVANANAAVARADAELAYATHNLDRVTPLLQRQFVTVDQVDQARTLVATRSQAASQARSQLALAEAGLVAAQAQQGQAAATVTQSQHQIEQASHSVVTLDPFVAQLAAKQAAIDTARYNFEHCKVVAPFTARVTNLTISQGAYVHTGEQIFTLIDTRVWWAVANYRETQLQHIHPGMEADVYVLSRPDLRLKGVVESIGFGVKPDADIVGRLTPGLPDVQRTLNWVHLASRFPVRIRLLQNDSQLFRIGESAVVVVRGERAFVKAQ